MAGTRADIPRRTFLVRLAAVAAALLVTLAAAGRPLVASAASVASITLDCRVNGVPLAGDTYGLVCLADVTYDASSGTITSYATREAFAPFDYDWSNMKSSELDEAAKFLASHAGEKSLYERTAVSGSSGSVGFWGLDPGLYLVARIAAADANASYACDPLLITVPLADGGQLVWNVTSQPKFGEPEPDDPDDPDKPEEPDDPDKPDDPDNPDDPDEPNPGDPDEPDDPDEPGKPGDPDDPGSPKEPGEPWIPLANTGDAAFAGVGALLVLGGAAVILAGVIRSRSNADPVDVTSDEAPDDAPGSSE